MSFNSNDEVNHPLKSKLVNVVWNLKKPEEITNDWRGVKVLGVFKWTDGRLMAKLENNPYCPVCVDKCVVVS